MSAEMRQAWRDAHKEETRAYNKKYREDNKDKLKKHDSAYYQANKETIQVTLKAWRAANPDKVRQYREKWEKANPEKAKAAALAYDIAHRAERSEKSRNRRKDPEQAPIMRANERAYRQANPEKVKARQKKYVAANPQKIFAKNLKRFGLTVVEYNIMLEAQNGRCAICCSFPVKGKRLAIDHDHDSGAVRGLLCDLCNIGIGAFSDSPQRMVIAAAYVKNGGTPHTPLHRRDQAETGMITT